MTDPPNQAFMIGLFLLASGVASAVYWGIALLIARFLVKRRYLFWRGVRVCYLTLGAGVIFCTIYLPVAGQGRGGGPEENRSWHALD